MRLRLDCGGCERDSNDPALHAPHCNYSQWPGLYDTIEAQKLHIQRLDSECRSANKRVCDAGERQRQRDHHEVVCLVLKEFVATSGVSEKVEALAEVCKMLNERLDIQMHASELLDGRLDAALKRIELLERDMGDVHPNALSGAKT